MAKLRGDANFKYINQYNKENYYKVSALISRRNEPDLIDYIETCKADGIGYSELVRMCIREHMDKQ